MKCVCPDPVVRSVNGHHPIDWSTCTRWRVKPRSGGASHRSICGTATELRARGVLAPQAATHHGAWGGTGSETHVSACGHTYIITCGGQGGDGPCRPLSSRKHRTCCAVRCCPCVTSVCRVQASADAATTGDAGQGCTLARLLRMSAAGIDEWARSNHEALVAAGRQSVPSTTAHPHECRTLLLSPTHPLTRTAAAAAVTPGSPLGRRSTGAKSKRSGCVMCGRPSLNAADS